MFNDLGNEQQRNYYSKLMDFYQQSRDKMSNCKRLEQNDIDKMDNMLRELSSNSNPSFYYFLESHRPAIGKFIVIYKRLIRKLLKFLLVPFEEKISRFQSCAYVVVSELYNHIKTSYQNDLLLAKNNMDRTEQLDLRIMQLEKQLIEKTDEIKELAQRTNDTAIKTKDDVSDIMSRLNIKHEYDPWQKKTYSQAGEDGILFFIFHSLGIPIQSIKYLDLGANHAKAMSNTCFFYENGASGVLVEANPHLVEELCFYRHRDIILNKLVSVADNTVSDFFVLSADSLSSPKMQDVNDVIKVSPEVSLKSVEKVQTISVNTIIEKYFAGIAPTFISLDIEGYSIDVLKSIDLDKYRPLCIVVESIEYMYRLAIGLKINEVVDYMLTMDYIEYAFTGINSIFIDKNIFQKEV